MFKFFCLTFILQQGHNLNGITKDPQSSDKNKKLNTVDDLFSTEESSTDAGREKVDVKMQRLIAKCDE